MYFYLYALKNILNFNKKDVDTPCKYLFFYVALRTLDLHTPYKDH